MSALYMALYTSNIKHITPNFGLNIFIFPSWSFHRFWWLMLNIGRLIVTNQWKTRKGHLKILKIFEIYK